MRRVLLSVVLGVVICSWTSPAYGQVPTGDSVVGQGRTGPSPDGSIRYIGFDIEARSGPSGEGPSGHVAQEVAAFDFPPAVLEGPVSCLSVSGNDAVVGFNMGPLSTIPGKLVEVEDNGPPGSGPAGYPHRQSGRRPEFMRAAPHPSALRGSGRRRDGHRRPRSTHEQGPVQERRLAELSAVQEPGAVCGVREPRPLDGRPRSRRAVGASDVAGERGGREKLFDAVGRGNIEAALVTGTFSGVGRTSEAAFGTQAFGSVVTLVEGKIQRYQWYLNPEEALEAAGLQE